VQLVKGLTDQSSSCLYAKNLNQLFENVTIIIFKIYKLSSRKSINSSSLLANHHRQVTKLSASQY